MTEELVTTTPSPLQEYSQAVFVNFSPPSIDLLLPSVAASFKERAIASTILN